MQIEYSIPERNFLYDFNCATLPSENTEINNQKKHFRLNLYATSVL